MIYTSNAALTPVSAIVREQVNGEYALTATFPAKDAEYITKEVVLEASTPYGKQYFRARENESRLDGTVVVYAPHIFYDLNDYFIEDVYPTTKDAQDALDIVLAGATESHSFTGYSDISTISSARYVYKSVAESIMQTKDANAMLNRWGGELERDNYTVKLLARKGADRGVSIRYRKNLTGLIARSDLTNVKTRIYPTGLTEKDAVLEIDSKYVDSSHISDYAHPKVGRVHFPDVKVDPDGDYPTLAAAKAELKARAEALFDAGVDLPNVSLEVEFVDLSKTVEYSQYAGLESVYLGDTVHVAYEPLGVDVTLRVSEYEWDACANRYTRLVIGALPTNIGQSVIDADIDISAINDSLTSVVKQGERYYNVLITHDDGIKVENPVTGVTAIFNGDEVGFYDASDKWIGGLVTINGQVAFAGSVLCKAGDADTFISLEPDPDDDTLDVARLYVLRSGSPAEFCRIGWNGTAAYVRAMPITGSGNRSLVLTTTDYGSFDGAEIVLWKAATNSAAIKVRNDTDSTEIYQTPTAITFSKNGSPVETW